MSDYFINLDRKVIKKYGDRKDTPGLLALFYDCKKDIFLGVPKKMEHMVFIQKHLKVEKEKIRDGVVDASHLVPVTIIIDPEKMEIKEMATGVSSLEMGECKVQHTKRQLESAHMAGLQLIERAVSSGDFTLNKGFKQRLITRFLRK